MGILAVEASLAGSLTLLAVAAAASLSVAGTVLISLSFIWRHHRSLLHWGIASILLGIGYFLSASHKFGTADIPEILPMLIIALSLMQMTYGSLKLVERETGHWLSILLLLTLGTILVSLTTDLTGTLTSLPIMVIGFLMPAYLLFDQQGYYRLCALPFAFQAVLVLLNAVPAGSDVTAVLMLAQNSLFLLQSMALILAAAIRRNTLLELAQKGYQEEIHGEKQRAEILATSENMFRQAERIAGLFHWEAGENCDQWLSVSENAARVFGMEPEDFLQDPLNFYKIVHPEDLERVLEVYRSVVENPRAYALEYRIVKKDQSTAYLREIGEPAFDEAGAAVKFKGTTQDITPLRQAEIELRNSRERLELLARSSGERFWEMGPDLRFNWFKDHEDFEIPLQKHDILGKTRWEIAGVDPENDPRWAAHKAVLEAHKPFRDFEYQILDQGGKLAWRSVSGLPIFGRNREFLGYLGTSQDITRRRGMEIERNQALQAAEDANRAKSEFLANMSHELRTPLNSVIGFSEIMVREEFGKHEIRKYAEYSQDIQNSATHLLSVIDDILDLSRVESGQMEPEETVFSISDLIDASQALVRLAASRKEISLPRTIPQGLPALLADQRLVKQVLVNLLANAVRFTPEGGTVGIEAQVTLNDCIQLTVTDTGVGIQKEAISRALEPFGQVRNSHQVAHEGTGLGLPLSVKLMELHGGDLRIDSTVGEGTIVTLTFPADRTRTIAEAP